MNFVLEDKLYKNIAEKSNSKSLLCIYIPKIAFWLGNWRMSANLKKNKVFEMPKADNKKSARKQSIVAKSNNAGC